MEIRLCDICVQRNRIDYRYERSVGLDRYFTDQSLFVEYLEETIDFTGVPQSILAVPFVVNLLPLCWVLDICIRVPELDKTLWEAIPQIKEGFCKVYPNVPLGGGVVAERVVENQYEPSEHSVCLFSGGADAMYTLLRHRQENPTMVNVWGVDIGLEDAQGHDNVESHCRSVAQAFDLEYICVKSTLRLFLDEQLLNRELYGVLGDYWWHGAQHSIGLVSVLAPLNYLRRSKVNYIASSFTETEFQMGVKCVSYPVIDEALTFANTKTCHDGYEARRIDKIEYICSIYQQENLSLDLKVCFQFHEGRNCCRCEKCMRTMMAILVFDPQIQRYGFDMTDKKARPIRRFLLCNEVGAFRWEPIRQAYRQHNDNNDIRWLERFEFNRMNSIASRVTRLLERFR